MLKTYRTFGGADSTEVRGLLRTYEGSLNDHPTVDPSMALGTTSTFGSYERRKSDKRINQDNGNEVY